MVKFKRKHKTRKEANKVLKKVNETSFNEYKIFTLKNARIWKFVIATELEFLHELY